MPDTSFERRGDSLLSPTFLIAMAVLAIVGGTVAAVFAFSSAEVQNVVAGAIVGTGLGAVTGFYFGSTKGSQGKDAILAEAVSSKVTQAPEPPPAP